MTQIVKFDGGRKNCPLLLLIVVRPVRVEGRQLSPRQYVEEGLQSAINHRAFLEIKIFNYEHKFPRWRETLDAVLKKLAADLNPTPGNVLIDRDVLLALIGQMALKAPPGESGGVVTPPAHSSAPDEEPKKKPAKGRPVNRVVQSRYEIIRSVARLKGENYCDALRGKLSTPVNWQNEHPPCPKGYSEAWDHADPKQQKKWRKRITDEHYRATRPPKKHSS